ncbi:MAG: FHA domain-containing protein, partial [Leifsonia flava]
AAPRDASGYAIPPRDPAPDAAAASSAAVAAASVIPVAAPAPEQAPDLPPVAHVSIAETMGQPAARTGATTAVTDAVVNAAAEPDATNPWAPREQVASASAGASRATPPAVPPAVAPIAPVAPPVVPHAEVPPAPAPPTVASPPVFFEPVPASVTPAVVPPISPPPVVAPAAGPTASAEPVAPAAPATPPTPATPPPPVEAPLFTPPAPEDDGSDEDDDFGHYDTVITAGRPTPAAPVEEDADDLEATVVVDRRPRVRWRLALDDGTQLDLTAPRVVLGRNPVAADPGEQALAVPDQTRTLSKTHARLILDDGEWTVTDLGSTNGVLLYDEHGGEILVDPGVAVSVADGFVLGKVAMRVTFVEENR